MINYYLLMKPGIILGNLLTVAAGFLLASKEMFDPFLFLSTLLGLSLIMASGCVFNNYIDQPLDKKMKRTQNRALVKGIVTSSQAIAFGIVLSLVGNLFLFFYTNGLTLLVADFGFFVYVVLYSLWKSKTIYSTAVGSIAGAIPPVVGYTAVTQKLDLGAVLLFLMMILWQMPHFFAIAFFRYEDFKAAGIPVLPLLKGSKVTKIRMFIYILAFTLSASLLTFFGYTGSIFLGGVLIMGALWLALCSWGFSSQVVTPQQNEKWGKQMFQFSLVVITCISLTLPLH